MFSNLLGPRWEFARMKLLWNTARRELTFVAAVALLAGCGGSSLPAAAPGTGGGTNPPPEGSGPSGALGAKQLEAAYNLPLSRGAGQIVAIVDAFDNPHVESDLATYRSYFGLGKAKFYKFNQKGEQRDYPPGNADWGFEINLDTQMVSASCPKCTIYLVEANSARASDMQKAVARAVTLGAHIISNSYSGGGLSKKYYDANGVTYLASAGDSGYGESQPADFDTVAAIGGTVLVRSGGKRGWKERVWPGTGGGCSTQAKPPWQQSTGCAHRLANDVSAVARGVAEYDSYRYGGWTPVDGTSISSPLVAGIFALAGNATQQVGGRTFWQRAHHADLYPVSHTKCSYCRGRYSPGGGWGSPDGIGAF
jgi:subtilase family serine protease